MPVRLNRILITVLTGVLLVVGSSYAQQDEYRRSIDKIGGEIRKIGENLNANKALLKNEQDRLLDAEKKLLNLQNSLSSIGKELQHKQDKVAQLGTQLEYARSQQKRSQEAYAKLLKSRYKAGQQDYLQRFLNQENPYAVGRLNNYHRYFTQALKIKYAELNDQIQTTQEIVVEQQKIMSDLVLERERQSALEAEMQTTKKLRAGTVAKLHSKVSSSQEKLEKLKKDRSRLKSLLDQIARQAEELRKLEAKRQAQREQERQRQQTQKPVTKPVARAPVRGGFGKQKGRLQYPVSSKPRYKFGNRMPESGMRADGMFFPTKGSVDVKSIFRGRVLFADFLKGYGLLIIVDHGDDHISLYGHNELLYKRVGDTVETNEKIAKSGVSGGLKSAGLYFEVRRNATPVNPATWCR